jgi:hypothetical protein
MSSEDALFRSMRPAAVARLDKLIAAGDHVDVSSVVESTLQDFAHSIKLDGLAESLRARLTQVLEEHRVRRLAEKM